MLRVVAVVPGNQDEPGKLRVDKLAMAAFATGDTDKARPLQVTDELTDFARHMVEGVRRASAFPAAICRYTLSAIGCTQGAR